MNNSLEIKLKEVKTPTLWERFVGWLNGDEEQPRHLAAQVPKTGTNTEILLSQTQKLKLQKAFESPGERSFDTGFARRSESTEDSSSIFL